MKRFGEVLQSTPEKDQQQFYRDNFIDLRGAGLDKAQYDHPSIA